MGTARVDLDLRIAAADATFHRVLDTASAGLVGRQFPEVISPEHVEDTGQKIRDLLTASTGEDTILLEACWQSEHVESVRTDVVLHLARNALGAADHFLAFVIDPARAPLKPRQTGTASAADLERYRCLVENAPYCIHELDPAGRILSMNTAGLQMVGCTAVGEVFGLPYLDLVGEEDRPRVSRLMQEAFGGEARHFEYEGAGGQYYRSNFVPIADDADHVQRLMGITQDLTKQRDAARALQASEEQLQQAREMEAIGRLAGAIAHDFNNFLMVIRGNTELLRVRLSGDEEGRQLADELGTAASHATHMVRQLLTFSRRTRLIEAPVSIHAVVEEVGQLLRRSLDENIRLVLDLRSPESTIRGDSGRLYSVVLNLALNAADAMPEGGELRFVSSRVRLEEAECRELGEGLVPGEFVRLEIFDTGVGIPAEVLPHVFEPFFTTKPADKGTGLGLAIAYSTVVDHHGAVKITCEPGKGTRVTLWLPLTTAAPREETADPASPDPVCGQVLVVDDNPSVRNVVSRALRGHGCTVSEAGSGPEALRVIEREGDRLDAVVLDLAMPEPDGLEVLRRVRRRHADLPVLILTAFAENHVVRSLLAAGATRILDKPIELDELTRAVSRACRTRPGH